MESLIQNFGINGYLLVAQIVNFLIVLYLLKRFAYKPIFKLLEDRRKTIEQGQKNAERAEKALQEATDKEKQMLRSAQTEAQKILSDANKQAGTIVAEANDAGKKQIEKILADAKEEISRDRAKTEKELAIHVAEIAVDMLKRSLPALLDKKDQEKVLEKAAKELKVK